MIRWGWALALFLAAPVWGGQAENLARAIRENSFDPQECYRVRDLSLSVEDIKIYLADGHLMFSRPVDGKPIAAAFVADVPGGDAEVILLPPDGAERRSLASYINSPNLDEHFRTGVFLFTGDEYETITAQFRSNPTNRRAPETGAALAEEFTPVLRNLSTGYETRLALDLLNHASGRECIFASVLDSPNLGAFDLVYDPLRAESIIAGKMTSRDNRLFLDAWTSFKARSMRDQTGLRTPDLVLSDYRVEAAIAGDLDLKVTTRVKVRVAHSGARAVSFDISPLITVASATVEGQPAEVLQRESQRGNATHSGNEMFLVAPTEPLMAGRDYEFVFEHSGKVVFDTGDRVLFVSARENWYPLHGLQFATYDMTFRHPKDLDLVAPGELIDTHAEGDSRVTRFRTRYPIRFAGFNLGNYARARAQRGGYVVEVCANRALERDLKPAPGLPLREIMPEQIQRRSGELPSETFQSAAPNPLDRLREIANGVAAAMEFMAGKFGPPALDHLTVSPIPGTFGQGFPGLIYLSTLSYLRTVPHSAGSLAQTQELFFQQVLQAHETAHQWWGNRVTTDSYRDAWMMEALANYSALLYLEKTMGGRAVEMMLETYRSELLAKGETGQQVESAGPITMGARLESSLDPGAYRSITYGKGTWIIHMLRRYLGDQRFFAMLDEVLKRYDRKEMSTEDFRRVAARFTPPKSDDADLETFFDTWVYGTGIPALKMSYSVRGRAPALRLVGTVTQTQVDGDFAALVPVEVHLPGGQASTLWVRCGSEPALFTMALKQPPTRVTLDPDRAVLRR